jgi:predicted nucleic acid-binding protein
MKALFADSFYFFAVVNRGDPAHAKALALSASFKGRLVTTAWALTEFADGMSRPVANRPLFLQILADLRARPDTLILPTTDQLLQDGIDFYSQRPDKELSLTDCISFVVMTREGITEALTGDHHFEQAGFVALLK